MNNKTKTYLTPGVLLTYFGLKDDEFLIWYHGVALALGITALVYAYLEYKNTKNKKSNK